MPQPPRRSRALGAVGRQCVVGARGDGRACDGAQELAKARPVARPQAAVAGGKTLREGDDHSVLVLERIRPPARGRRRPLERH